MTESRGVREDWGGRTPVVLLKELIHLGGWKNTRDQCVSVCVCVIGFKGVCGWMVSVCVCK